MKRIRGADLDFGLERQIANQFRQAGFFSPALEKNRHAPLDFRSEARDYLRRMLPQRPSGLRRVIHDLAKQISVEPRTRTFIAIAAHCNERGITRTLASFLSHPSNRAELRHTRIVILVNGTKGELRARDFKDECFRIQADIEDISKQQRELKVSLLTHYFSSPKPIGSIKGILADAIVETALEHGLPDPRLALNDADQLAAGDGYLRALDRAFHSNSRLDLVAGPVFDGYHPDGSSFLPEPYSAPELLISCRLQHALEKAWLPRFLSFGNNSALRLSAYCAAGGFDFETAIREDLRLGFNVKAMRRNAAEPAQSDPRHSRFLREAFVVTNPRRTLTGILRGKPAWSFRKTFLDVHGSTLNLERLLESYRSRRSLIQAEDLVRAAAGSRAALEKVARRAHAIFLRDVASFAPSLLHRSTIHRIASDAGLVLSNPSYDRGGNYRSGRIDSDSPLFPILYRAANP